MIESEKVVGYNSGTVPGDLGVPNILDQIAETKRAEVARAQARRPLDDLKRALDQVPPPRDFYDAVAATPVRGVNLIAEIKRKSPSAGLIRPDFDPVALARIYHAQGANGLSVLTDEPYFDGRLEFIEQVKKAVPLPVLRKDFMLTPYQIVESRVAGADAVLLIGELLSPDELKAMADLARELGMTSLIEVHEAKTLDWVRQAVVFSRESRSLLGINNRNLKLQKTDLATTATLARRVPENAVVVSESGIKTRADVEQLTAAGARALLIGETFMRSADVGSKITELLGPLPEG